MTSVISGRYAVRAPPGGIRKNELLASLPLTAWRLWEPHLEIVDLERGELLHESERPIRHAYFPLTAVVAKLYSLDTGGSAECALIGNEGIVGFPLVLGGESTPSPTFANPSQ